MKRLANNRFNFRFIKQFRPVGHYFLMLIPWFAIPTDGHLSFLRNAAQEVIAVQIKIAMITFAVFMIRNIYCKLNSIRGNPLLIERLTDHIYSNTPTKKIKPTGEVADFQEIMDEQRLCIPKANKKLPSWIKHHCLFAGVPLEQCTSEVIAKAKASLFHGNTMLSLTGGLGVDDYAFSPSFHTIISLDPDAGLNALAAFNWQQLGITNINRLTTTAEDYLQQASIPVDCIYADPDRRQAGNRAVSDVNRYTPDIFSIYRQYGHLAQRWLIKLSPMTDIQWLLKALGSNAVIRIFTYKGELKEMLVETGPNIEPETIIVAVDDESTVAYRKHEPVEVQQASNPVFCELSAAAIKADFRNTIIKDAGYQPVIQNSNYFIGNHLIPLALGRCFTLEKTIAGSLGEIKTSLEKMGINQANISGRDFVLSAEETRKKLGLRDGGEWYLFFTGKEKMKSCFATRKMG